MSQHHIRVTHLSGATLKLVTGFDPRLREFFLELRDARLTPPDERPEELSEEAQAALDLKQADYVNYDSLGDAQPMRSISDVEAVLEENGVPFGNDEDNPEGLNPQLLPLLIVVMNEKENGGPEVGRIIRDWDAEAEEVETEQAVLRDEQNTEWAAEARANREADQEQEPMGSCVCTLPRELCDFQCPDGHQARAEFEQD
ncbi:hypothetical protein [Hymenobacter sp. YC55]|uniref:hypothetical protein n=1 Tax=Hymenobacter sp. YC55 TaxID=3034019 RepID=UPI0023F653B7|nr:hypothetical protein [Hymenobacter sp. YC55]MDF7815368.1 hypothetical protein [Hymenobacter sp. YC55]